jgi:3-mercaptopyruvate sulfurtransferase SseA
MVNKTYTALATLPKVKTGQCNAILDNKMQCWRAADFQIEFTTTQPAVVATKTTPAVDEKVERTVYQMCRRHANEDKAKYDATLTAV